ncbi:MAG: 50S ribosomal protein L23 [Candidatus Omnitrophica bacterium]|nr:50S ribosomal protein L23 [Candidatus Omnitrophota bacterium]
MRNPYITIKLLLRTEKGTLLTPKSKYLFAVDKRANKPEIKDAVEKIYKVKVSAVNTTVVPGKKRRVRYVEGKRPDWKKAIVTLKEGKIDLT